MIKLQRSNKKPCVYPKGKKLTLQISQLNPRKRPTIHRTSGDRALGVLMTFVFEIQLFKMHIIFFFTQCRSFSIYL